MDPHVIVVWHDFFTGSIGAAAALAGLLFVAISINLEQILHYPQLPGRAAGTLGILLGALVVSGFVLMPGQDDRVLGIQIAATGSCVAAQAVWVSLRTKAADAPAIWQFERFITLVAPSMAMIVGAVMLVAGHTGGLYWVSAAVLLAFLCASINAWVLLVEIKR